MKDRRRRERRRFNTQAQATEHAKTCALVNAGQAYYVIQSVFGSISVSDDAWGWKVLETHVLPKSNEGSETEEPDTATS
jgi:hypothetical protein